MTGVQTCALPIWYQLPLDFTNGLPYLSCRKPSVEELSSLTHIIMTSDIDWDPSIYDNVIDDLEEFHDITVDGIAHEHFDQYGEYQRRTIATHSILPEEAFFDAIEHIPFVDLVDDLMDAATLKVLVMFMALILPISSKSRPISNCYVPCLDGRLLIQSRKHSI